MSNALRDVPPDDLSNYGARVFLTMGDAEDFGYFLPRLLDIATTEDWCPSPQVLLGKLRLAGWNDWPKHRRAAVTAAIDAWFAQCLETNPPNGAAVDEVLCGAACAGLDIEPYLDELKKHDEALKAFADVHAHTLSKRNRLARAFWEECPNAEQEVVRFLKSVLSG